MDAQKFKTKIEELLLDNESELPGGFIYEEVIRKNSIKNLKILVDLNINLNSFHYGQTFLHLCCIPAEGAPPGEPFDTRRCELIRFLIAKGARVNAKNEDGDTPLAFALKNKYFVVVKFLVLNYDVDVNFRDDYGKAPLHNLIRNYKFHIEDENLLARFLELGFNINFQDNHGNSILHYACIYQEADVIEFLIKNGADVNLKNSNNSSPLHFVLSNSGTINHNRNSEIGRQVSSTLQVIQVLLRYNADVNAVDKCKGTALYYACCKGIVEAVQLLLKSGANPNVFDIDEYTPIMGAFHNLEIIKCLVDNNADVNARNNKNGTILHIACNNCRLEVVKFLLENGADPNVIDFEGFTPMLRAVNGLSKSCKVVKLLLDWNADVYAQNNYGETLLHLASQYGRVDVVRFVLHRHIDLIYMDDKLGRNALHLAGHNITPETLLDYGADTQKRDNYGIIPMINNVDTLYPYIIKMKCVGRILKIDPELYNELFYKDDDDGGQSNKLIGFNVNYFEAKCNAEIGAMKIAKVGDSNITLYSLLMNGYRGIVVNIFGYEELITILEDDSYREQFPLYIELVLTRVAESRMRRELLETAGNCVFTGIFKNLPYVCVRKIFGYLNVREIKLFLNAQRLEDVEEN